MQDRTLLSTFTVTNLLDGGDGSLREAIAAANARPGADILRFAPGLQGTILLTTGQLAITDDLTIRGPGAESLAVSGSDSSRVFAVVPEAVADDLSATPTLATVQTAPAVRIERLAIVDGLATDAPGLNPSDGFSFGGGLYSLGGTVHLDRVVMTGNEARGPVSAGGAVANEFGGTLTVSGSRFEDNRSNGFVVGVGGAITSDSGPTAGGGTTGQPSVEVDLSTFVSNTARATFGANGTPFAGLGGGGAILNVTGALSVRRSHFEGNVALGGSGSVDGQPDAVSGGAALGGAILSGDISPFAVADSTLRVIRSTFAGNTATGGDGGEADLPGGLASGGAIAVSSGSDAAIERNAFDGNSALGGTGSGGGTGGVATGGAVSGSGGAGLSLGHNAFAGNLARGGPGAVGRGGALGLSSVDLAGFLPGPATASSAHDSFGENLAEGLGGGVFNDGDLTVRGGQFRGNRALGRADVVVELDEALKTQGGALGGGIANYGTLAVDSSRFVENRSVGGDDVVSTGEFFAQEPTFPGNAFGGGIANYGAGVAEVSGSHFLGNVAEAGDRGAGEFASIAGGGALANGSGLSVVGSSFRDNRALAGNEATSPFHNGHALGGAINSGSLVPAFDPTDPGASLSIGRSVLVGNDALGGDNNTVTLPPDQIPPADGPNNGYGGGILVYQGLADLDRVTLRGNRALGGDGGGDAIGSLGVGGGAFFFNFLGAVDATVTNSLILGNDALGGVGGHGLGGGIASGSLGAPFGGPGSVTIDRSQVAFNAAEGGDGGDGLGGGLYNGAGSTLGLHRMLVFANLALAGPGGEGIGGGLYNLGTLDEERSTILANIASTSDDDCFGC